MSVGIATFLKALFPPTRFTVAVTLCLIALFIVLGVNAFYVRYLTSHWQEISTNEEHQLRDDVQLRFDAYQKETLRFVEEAAHSCSTPFEQIDSNRTALITLFQSLKKSARMDLSLEVYNERKQTLCWVGNRSPSIDSSQLRPAATSFVMQGPIYSYVIVCVPLSDDRGVHGYVVGKRLFNVNYPINNRFINNSAFAAAAPALFDVLPEFDFSSDAKPNDDTRILSIQLKNLKGSPIGFAYVPRWLLAARIDEFHRQAYRGVNILFLILSCLFIYKIIRWTTTEGAMWLKLLMISIALWGLRFIFIEMNIPSSVFPSGIFDPVYFSSPFAFGFARTIGDMLVSSLFLLVNIVVVTLLLLRWSNAGNIERIVPSVSKKVLCLSAVVFLMFILLLFTRGFSAVIRSAVFDSTLGYNDPTSVVPSFIVSMMLMCLLFIACSYVLASVMLIHVSHKFMRVVVGLEQKARAFFLLSLMLIALSLFFGTFQPHPLMNQVDRMLIVFGLLVLTLWIGRRYAKVPKLSKFGMILLISCSSLIILMPQIDSSIHEMDRAHVELLATEILRPTDTWLRLIVNKALDGLSTSDAGKVLSDGDTDDIEKLAFTQWAKSILSKEGYNCAVTIVDTGGKTVSDFHVGIPPHLRHHEEPPVVSRFVSAEDKNVPGLTARRYTGYAPIFSDNGSLAGGVWLELSANKRAILLGEAPEILRNYSRENFENHYRSLVLAEYAQGKMVYASGENFPLERQLPRIAKQVPNQTGIWIDEIINQTSYETYLVREDPKSSNGSWMALSMESLGVRWHFYSYLRYVLFYLLVLLSAIIVMFGLQIIRNGRIVLGFNAKLIAAFVVVSLVPVVILAYYNSQYALERVQETTTRRLSEQTSVVVSELEKELGVSVPFSLANLTDSQCEDLAGSLNVDFNVYFGAMLQASSKPEVFTAELLDESLSSDAYVNIMLQKKSFYAENQSIGTLPYVVGYRPLLSEAGNIIGVVSVPTLFRQTAVNEDRTRRNVFLFGAYIIALAFSVIVGTIFARRISSPIRRLTTATRRIAEGRLDVILPTKRQDELGDLEQAFSKMAKDLKETQERMLKAERELAWKEMAKQVAHEIKNPLTPMKLSVQHLRQAYKDNIKQFLPS